MVEFVEVSILDLIKATQFLHLIKPSLRDKFVFGIEKAKPFDLSVVFHLTSRDKDGSGEDETIILSAEYILTHSFWNGARNDRSSVDRRT